jgi:hypothetical protein
MDERRVIGTTVQRVEEEVLQALYTYLNPLVGGSATGPGHGWPFGRLLKQGELYQIVHSVDGVQFVKILRVYETDLRTGQQSPQRRGAISRSSRTSSWPRAFTSSRPSIRGRRERDNRQQGGRGPLKSLGSSPARRRPSPLGAWHRSAASTGPYAGQQPPVLS